MTREKLAAILLALLVGISAWNINKIAALSREIGAELSHAELMAQGDDFEAARQSIAQALELWLKAEHYTHIFIRHPEIDSCTDAFYEALEAAASDKAEDISTSLSKLRYHIESIASMERISLGSVF